MNVFDKGLVTVLACHALFVLVALPLLLRRIPPNPVYGYRTCATLRDETVWYNANAYFAGRFIGATLLSSAAALVLHHEQGLAAEDYMHATIALLVAPVILAGLLTSRFIHKGQSH